MDFLTFTKDILIPFQVNALPENRESENHGVIKRQQCSDIRSQKNIGFLLVSTSFRFFLLYDRMSKRTYMILSH